MTHVKKFTHKLGFPDDTEVSVLLATDLLLDHLALPLLLRLLVLLASLLDALPETKGIKFLAVTRTRQTRKLFTTAFVKSVACTRSNDVDPGPNV